MWTPARKGTLNPGSAAPDFTVTKLDGHVPVRLASLWEERPVVLVFGSYT
jgi:peroxiredoxin